MDQPDPPILQHFTHAHLPPHLQAVSRPLGEIARQLAKDLPPGPELSAGLRKLLEAKDCFVRAAIEAAKPEPKPLPHPGTIAVHLAEVWSLVDMQNWALVHVGRGYARLLIVTPAELVPVARDHLKRRTELRRATGSLALLHERTGAKVLVVGDDDCWERIKDKEFDAAWVAPEVSDEVRGLLRSRLRLPGMPGAKVVHTVLSPEPGGP